MRPAAPQLGGLLLGGLLLGGLLTACGGPPTVVPPEPPAQVATPPVVTAPQPGLRAAPGWACGGELVPPTGYLQATRFVDRGPDAAGRAVELALAALRAKVCTGPCAALLEKFTVWKTGEGPDRACAMAVVKAADVAGWKAEAFSSARFDAALDAAVAGLALGGRTLIGPVRDAGATGGVRARWLVPRLTRAVTAAGGTVVPPPADWTGIEPPAGIDAVLTATLIPRLEGQVPVLDVALTAHARDGYTVALRSAAPVLLPAAVAPHVAPLPLAPADAGIRVVMDLPGAGLCAGDRVTLELEASEPLHVRIVDLYGADGALLLHAGEVPAGRTPIGEVFQALPAPASPAERFLVVAAPAPEALGDFAGLGGVCRFDADRAAALHRLEGLPAGARISVDGFRITDGPPCPTRPPEAMDALQVSLANLEVCGP